MKPQLPSHATLKDISATYNEHTIPRELQLSHTLPPEIWAEVVVAEGEVELKTGGKAVRVTQEQPVLIPPHTPFSLASRGKPVRFSLRYYHEPVLHDGKELAGLLGRKRVA